MPWGERHPYVLEGGNERDRAGRKARKKKLHVSPLMGMDQSYSFQAGEPGTGLTVQIESRPEGEAAGRASRRPSRCAAAS